MHKLTLAWVQWEVGQTSTARLNDFIATCAVWGCVFEASSERMGRKAAALQICPHSKSSVAACKTEPSQMAILLHLNPEMQHPISAVLKGYPLAKRQLLQTWGGWGAVGSLAWKSERVNTGGEMHDRNRRVEFGRSAECSRAGYWAPAQKGRTEGWHCHPH